MALYCGLELIMQLLAIPMGSSTMYIPMGRCSYSTVRLRADKKLFTHCIHLRMKVAKPIANSLLIV